MTDVGKRISQTTTTTTKNIGCNTKCYNNFKNMYFKRLQATQHFPVATNSQFIWQPKNIFCPVL
jgi:hypothetical protein